MMGGITTLSAPEVPAGEAIAPVPSLVELQITVNSFISR